MALKISDRVKETTVTTGTGTITLGGAVTGFRTFASVLSNADTTYYAIVGSSEFEVGLGTFSGSTLTRDTVLSSSNSGNKVDFAAGTKNVFITQPADKAVYKDANDNIDLDTDSVSEGSTNLYFTNERVDDRVGSLLVAGDNVTLSYDDDAGTLTISATEDNLSNNDTDDLAEGSTNLYYTDTRFDTRLATKDTDDVSEGSTNLYHTTERVQDVVGGQFITNGTHTGISFSYDDFTDGAIDATVSLSSFSTSDLSEGTNLYYTTARFDSAFSGKSTSDLSEGTNLYYTDTRFDTRLATKTTDNLTEGSNLYYTTARFDTAFSGKSTDNLSEGSTNLYYTDTRANAAIDARVTQSFVNALNVEAASVQANSVALGTDTTGNYVATIAGTANKISVTGSGSESAAVTLSLPDDVQIASNLTVGGNLTVNGTTTQLDTTNLAVSDNLFELNSGLTGSPVNDSGMLVQRGTSDNAVFMWDESVDKFTLGTTTATGTATGNITVTTGSLVANLEGNVTGNVTGTVSSLSNHDTGDLAEGSNLYLTQERVEDYVGGMVSGNTETGIAVTYDDVGGKLNFVIDTLNQDTTGNAATATALQTARNFSLTGDVTASAVSFDGTANVALSTSIGSNTVGITELNVTDGTSGQVLTTDGAGTLSFSSISGYSDSDVESYLDGGTSTPTFASATVSGDLTVDTSTLKVDSTNNRVGIGTASPAALLELEKTNSTAISSGTAPHGLALSYGTADGNNAGLWFSPAFGDDQGIAGIASHRVSGYQTDLRFYTNNTNSARSFTERMRIDASGTLTTPSGTDLNIMSASGMTLGSTTSIALFKTNNVERMRIDTSGNVGIGTSSITNNTLGKTTYFGNSTSSITGDSSQARFWLGNNWYYNSGDKFIGTGYANLYSQQSGNHEFLTSTASGTAGAAATFNTVLKIDTSGNVGIGTSSPDEKLHVVGQGSFENAGNTNRGNLILGAHGSGTSKWSTLAGTHYNDATGSGNGSGSAGVMIIGCHAENGSNELYVGGGPYELNPATAIRFWTHTSDTHNLGGTERMRITSSGNVGINNTQARYPLNVYNSTNDTETLKLDVNGGSGSVQGKNHLGINHFGSDTTNSSCRISAIEDSTGSWRASLAFSTRGVDSDSVPTERMAIDSGGNVILSNHYNNAPSISGDTVVAIADDSTITVQGSEAGAMIICVYTTSGHFGIFGAGYADTATLIDGSSEAVASDTDGKQICVFKSANSHTVTIKNRRGSSGNYYISVFAGYLGV